GRRPRGAGSPRRTGGSGQWARVPPTSTDVRGGGHPGGHSVRAAPGRGSDQALDGDDLQGRVPVTGAGAPSPPAVRTPSPTGRVAPRSRAYPLIPLSCPRGRHRPRRPGPAAAPPVSPHPDADDARVVVRVRPAVREHAVQLLVQRPGGGPD